MKKQILGPYILGSAAIWGVTLIGASIMMRGAEENVQVLSLLGSAAGAHLILIWGPLAAAMKKLRDQLDDEQRE
jgi:hypothetical protein